MKKLIFILAVLFYACNAKAVNNFKFTRITTDTAKINKQIKKLNEKLLDLNNQLLDTRSRIPEDSVKLESALTKSHDAQVKSRKRSEQAVGGDLDDQKSAEKQAKKAAKETADAEDAATQLDKDRKKVKDLLKQIGKTQQELDKTQIYGG